MWMKELCDVMINTQTDLGRNEEETQHLLDEHQKFEKTANVSDYFYSYMK